jgi:hypothetical protein
MCYMHKSYMTLRSALFCDIAQRRVLILYWCFGPIFKGQEVPRCDFLTLEDGTDRFLRNLSMELSLYAA